MSVDTDSLLTVPESLERLKVSRTTFYDLVKTGRLATVKIGRSRRVSQAELERFIGRQTVGGRA